MNHTNGNTESRTAGAWLTIAMAMLAGGAMAQNKMAGMAPEPEPENDSIRLEQMQELVVSAVRTQKNAPYAVTRVAYKDLQRLSQTGRELPMLLAQTPGVMAWGENGLGTGTTYMRIRGAGDSRINVTLDGVSLNSPEDQCVFWANMNSYASLLGSVEVQRGVGTSTSGDAAFGGSLSLSSATPSPTRRVDLNFGYGSYNTMNYGVTASTGLLFDKLIIDGAWHQTQTDGFIHGTYGRSGSFTGGITFMPNDRLTLRYRNIGNFEHTGQAWNGVTAGDNDLSLMDGTYGAATGISTYRDLYDRGLGRYNTLYETLVYDDEGNFARDADGNYVTQRYTMRDGSLWRRTTDNFNQNHNLLTLAWDINSRWSLAATLRYSYGYGYYEEFRPQNKLKKFGIEDFTTSDGTTLKKDDFVRQKGLEQHTATVVANTRYRHGGWDVRMGFNIQQFWGNHFGRLTYAGNPELEAALLRGGDRYNYYDSDARKGDHNLFVKASYSIDPEWTLFGDLQYRHVGYVTDGINDKFYEDGGRYYNQPLDIDRHYHFFNPKAGVSWHRDGHEAYFSEAISHREPERNNFTDNGSYPSPKPEWMFDYELGYRYGGERWRAGANLYFMYYTNQFVQTGMESDIGEKLTTNIARSYRLGAELTAAVDVTKWLTVEANAALSQNRILDFDEVVEDWDNGTQTIHYDNSTLAFSPSVIANAFVRFHHRGFEATWHTNVVSRQYLDNTASRERSLPAFTTSNLSLSYTLKLDRVHGSRALTFGASLNNLFAARYAASGWVYSAICESAGHTNDNRYYQIGYVPAAGFTAMGTVALRL